MTRLFAALALLAILLIAGAGIWLAQTDMMPPVHTAELSIPDDRIPR